MVGLIRMDFYRNGVLSVVHLPKADARHERIRRLSEGWVLAWSVEV